MSCRPKDKPLHMCVCVCVCVQKSRMWRQYTCYFPANGSMNSNVFQPKLFCIPRGIIPHQGLPKQTYSLTDRLVLLQSDIPNHSSKYKLSKGCCTNFGSLNGHIVLLYALYQFFNKSLIRIFKFVLTSMKEKAFFDS